MIGFCIANAMKISNINLAKILVCSPWLFILKKLSNFVGNICWRQSKTTLGISINKEMIIGWWIDEVRFTSRYFGRRIWTQRCVTFKMMSIQITFSGSGVIAIGARKQD